MALIPALGSRSGAHMNLAVTLAAALTGGLRWHTVPAYIVAQVFGAIIVAWLAHVMFELSVLQPSTYVRSGFGQLVAEVIATFGLLANIWDCWAASVTAFAVAA
jgi:glycerol uptake facilitator-like aquaporin